MQTTTYCRLCPATCGLLVNIVDGKVVAVAGDQDHALTRGFTCIKGRHIGDIHADPHRLLTSLRSEGGGSERVAISADAAVEEISGRLRDIIDAHGPDAVGFYSGTQAAYASLTGPFANAWWRTIGSQRTFSSMTVDQSAKWVAEGRLGRWAAGGQRFADSDVWLLAGTNPLVSMQGGVFTGFPIHDGFRRLQELKRKGLRLIVVDPRRTEVATHADIHLQIIPGTDAVLFAGLLNGLIQNSLIDTEFCDRWVNGLSELRAAIEPFTQAFVASACGVSADDVEAATRLFGEARRGMATSGTGPDMAPWANVAEHLIQTMNVVCGRFPTEGEAVAGAAVLGSGKAPRAEVIGPDRTWEEGYKSGSGYGLLQGQIPAATLADEITRPGDDRLRALVVSGGNPAASIPGQAKVVEALSSLELLVTVDPFLSETARLAHYVIAPLMHLERPDTTRAYETLFDQPFAQYTPALLPRPAALIDDWEFFLRLAWAGGHTLKVGGREYAPGDAMSTTDEVLASLASRARVPLDVVKQHPHGKMFEELAERLAAPADATSTARFDVMPTDVADELRCAASGAGMATDDARPFRLVVRRSKATMNTLGKHIPALGTPTTNVCFLHPDDLGSLGVADKALVSVTSAHGTLFAHATADASMRPGVVSMTHGFGGLPGDAETAGTNVNILLSMDTDLQAISAMPRMSAVPVSIKPA